MNNVYKISKIESSLGHHDNLTACYTGRFGFINHHRDKMGTNLNEVHYKKARIFRGAKWFVYYSFKNPVTGKFDRIKIYKNINRLSGKEREEHAQILVEAINDWLAENNSPFDEIYEEDKSWTVIESFNFFKTKIPEMGIRPKSQDDYLSFINTLTTYATKYHQKKIGELSKANAMQMLSEMKEERKWANTTYNNYLSLARVLFNYLIEHSIVKENPFKGIKSLKETRNKHKPFTDTEWQQIKQTAPADLLTFMLFLYYSGTRPNEARQLHHEHLLRERGLIMIPGKFSKNRQDGYVPVPTQLFDLIPKGEGVIFGTSRNLYGAKFTTLKRKLNLSTDHTLYSIKATRAVHLAEDGASPYAIMQLFRHSSIEITMTYLRGLGVNIGREAADKARNL